MTSLEKTLHHLPDAPGIYLFYTAKKKLIYVGKATSLRSRVRSYFYGKRTPRPIEEMIHEVAQIKWKEADSVLEAIILEANAIKQNQPKYNVDGKDDKSWNYITISTDAYPRVGTLREHELKRLGPKDIRTQFRDVFGPYPGLNVQATFKLLRQLFHFSTCKPNAKRPCLYYQMGQCLGVCTGEITPKEYQAQVIRPLVLFLQGRKKQLIKELERRMKRAAKAELFEEASWLRDQLGSLQRIQDVALMNKSFFDDVTPSALWASPLPAGRQALLRGRKSIASAVSIQRVEGYDISNLGPTGMVGSMVVFVNGEKESLQYRRFKIKNVLEQSDVDCLEEVLRRRLNHQEWPFPQLFLIDGGRPQVNRAMQVLADLHIHVPVVGIAKGPERKKNEFIFGKKNSALISWVSGNQTLLIRVRDEAHRFAVGYQRKLRKIK